MVDESHVPSATMDGISCGGAAELAATRRLDLIILALTEPAPEPGSRTRPLTDELGMVLLA